MERLYRILKQCIVLALNQSELEANPDLVFKLADLCSSVQGNSGSVLQLGLGGHPAFVNCVHDGQLDTSLPFWLATRVIYRRDSGTQYS